MTTGPLEPPEKAGALIVRVWLEDGDPQLRIRMVGRLDLEANDQVTAVATDIDDMLHHIRDWLERFADRENRPADPGAHEPG